jgi:hypothetical protein
MAFPEGGKSLRETASRVRVVSSDQQSRGD